MADYYPLLAKAVAGLNDPTPEARQAIYNRARGALLKQLRSIKPPVPEPDIERESNALDEAVERLELEAGAPPPVRPTPPRPAAPTVSPPRGTPGVRAPAATRRRIDAAHPAAPQAPRERPSGARFWIVSLTIVLVVGIIGVTAWFLRDQRPEDAAHKPAASPVATDTGNGGKLLARAGTNGAAPSAPAPAAVPAPPAVAPPPAPAQAEPSAPIPSVPVATVPITLPPAPPPTATPGDAASPPAAPAKPPETSAPAPVAAAPPATPSPAPAPVAPIPAPSPANSAVSTPAPAVAAPAPASAPADPTMPAIPIAYRAALLVESPDDPKDRLKTYVGTVVWRVDNVSGDEGQPLSVAVHADIDVPDAKLKVSMTLKKNTDAAFEASHTIVLGFTFAPGGEYSGVKEIKLPRLRNEESPDGDPLTGVGVVPIMENYFLVGLSPGEANVTRNLDLMRSRGWFDVPLQLNNGRVAKITFEKGVQGDRTITDALASWK